MAKSDRAAKEIAESAEQVRRHYSHDLSEQIQKTIARIQHGLPVEV